MIEFEINNLDKEWKSIFENEFQKEYFQELKLFIHQEINSGKSIFPPLNQIFRAFELCSFKEVKVIIIGQDPYHGKGQANGLAFSVNKTCKIPPSLKNIYKELNSDLGINIPKHGDLSNWAKQGVLLLNSVLSVEEAKANAHQNKGWEIFTQKIINDLSEDKRPKVFILWGNSARKLKSLISPNHLIIESVHPSPLGAYQGFFGSKPFSKSNQFLKTTNQREIDWMILDDEMKLF